MGLETDSLLDRRRLKRTLSVWRIIAIVALTALVATIVGRVGGFGDRDHIARLSIDGVILADDDRDKALRKIAEDDSAKALILRIDSPGGTVVGGEALFRRLRKVAAEKPVVAVMGTVATSAGYMVAIGADHIVAHEGSITGSIGVILQSTDVTGLLEKIGVTTEAIKSRPLKAVPSPLEPLTEEGRQATRQIVLDIYDMFVDMVADRRKISADDVRTLADGRVYTGRQALERKLVDQLGDEETAREWLEKTHDIEPSLKVRDRDPEKEVDFLTSLRATVSEKMFLSETLTLDGLISLWHPDLR